MRFYLLGPIVVLALLAPSLVVAKSLVEDHYLKSANDGLTLKLEHSFFDESFDFINYIDQLEGSTRPTSYQQSSFALTYARHDWQIFGRIGDRQGSVSRDIHPFDVESSSDIVAIGFSKALPFFRHLETSFTIELSEEELSPTTLECVQYVGIIIGGSCDDADFTLLDGDTLINGTEPIVLPVLENSASSKNLTLGLTIWHPAKGRWHFGHDISLSHSEQNFSVASPLFDISSPFLLNSKVGERSLRDIIETIKSDIPQSTPWQTLTTGYQFSTVYFANPWVLNAGLEVLFVKRFNFDDPLGRKDYNRNVVLNGEAWYQFSKGALYLRGEAFSNYLLGRDSLAYTNKSSRFFKHPYGQLTVGVVISL